MLKRGIFLVGIIFSFVGCGEFESTQILEPVVPLEKYQADQLRLALRGAAMQLVKRLPSTDETKEAVTFSGYHSVIETYLSSAEFKNSIHTFHKDLFQMAGTVDGVNYSEPANLGTYLVTNEKDYRELLTAKYCVGNDFKEKDCASFKEKADQVEFAAGVLTTQAFLRKWESAFNFRRTKMAYLTFACKEFPDVKDVGLSLSEISVTIKPFTCDDCVPSCLNCHKNMNARASVFYSYDRKGFYNLNPNPDPAAGEITITDTNDPSTLADIITDSANPRFKGREIPDLRTMAEEMASDGDFKECMSQRMVNFALGQPWERSLGASRDQFVQMMEESNFIIKDFILKVMTSEPFLIRTREGESSDE